MIIFYISRVESLLLRVHGVRSLRGAERRGNLPVLDLTYRDVVNAAAFTANYFQRVGAVFSDVF